jgi:hypothetical protein
MNSLERQVKQQLEAEGWRVLRGGSPDFLALRVNNGEITEVKAIEVKAPGSKLSYEQGIYRIILERAGVPFSVVSPNSSAPTQSSPSQAAPSHSTPAHSSPDHSKPNQPMLPFQSDPIDARPAIPGQARPLQARPHHSRPLQASPYQPRPNPNSPCHPNRNQTNPNHTKVRR